MPFLSGRVSYTRLRVTGDAPAQVDDTFLAILKDHAFVESPAPRVGVLESGFTTGAHLLDTQFTYEKNGFGPCAHFALRVDYLHNFGTHFIIGRTIGTVFNPVVGGPDSVVNLESSVKTKYDGLLVSLEKRFANRYQLRASYTLAKAFNYANDDQIPFANGPLNPNNLQLEYGPPPNDQRVSGGPS